MSSARTKSSPRRTARAKPRPPARARAAAATKRPYVKPPSLPGAGTQLAKVRAFALSLAGASEKSSHGFPTFIVRKKVFAYFCDNHHGDGRLALWCCAPPGAQAMLVESNADHYFVPPYVGYQGWVGVRLDRDAAWSEIAAVLESAYETRAASLSSARARPAGTTARGTPRTAHRSR